MKQRFFVVIENKKTLDPKDVLFALREARPDWGLMSASLAAQHITPADAAPTCENCVTGHYSKHVDICDTCGNERRR